MSRALPSQHQPWSWPVGRLALGAALLLAVATLTAPARGADAQPVKKDTRAQLRPKEATFTTAIVPATAHPGDTVRFEVRVKIDSPWHIYRQSEVPAVSGPQPSGPQLTNFDFFDPSTLIFDKTKEWTASAKPIRKIEPAFPDIPFVEYHEGEVVWSHPLKVPNDAVPGNVAVRCQATYMLCSDQSCSMPGQWTLDPAFLTITPKTLGPSPRPKKAGPSARAVAPGPRARLVSARLDEPAADGPKPKVKDTKRAWPKVVRWRAEFVPAEAKPGDTVRLKLTANLDAGWHIFQYARAWDNNGPKPLLIDAYDLQGLTPTGEWSSAKPPTTKHDPNFPDIANVAYFEDEATWTLPVEVPAGLAPGLKAARVQAGFQICSSSQCQVPGQWTLPVATLTVAGAGGAPAGPTTGGSTTADPAPAATAAPVPAAKDEANPGATALNSTAATTVDPQESPASSPSEIERTAAAGIVPFLLACAGAGLLALAMPCVWPMIPVTVNFFVKQGSREGGNPTALAVTYCLAIIAIFTGIGVAFSALLGASSLSNLANNPWLNTTVAALFFVFGLSLLGLFEVRLPNFLLNASAQGEGRGGLVGVIFMATTLTITSFTCTFPVVGGLLVIAARGSYFYPMVGLATFATVVALPFFLLALAPGLLQRMPKSGDWMNSVKVVGGLVEVAAAFKFVNTAEIGFHSVPENAWVDETTLLTIWVAMALVCGVYLLGLFRTDHDQKDAGIGPGRIVFGSGFLFLALYLAPALFGHAPEGQIYNQLVVGLLPPRGSEVKATSADPAVAQTQEKSKHGVLWGMSYEAALAEARKSNRRVLVDFTGVNCSVCRQMERSVMPRADVIEAMKEFVTVQLHTDFVPINSISQDQREELGAKNIALEERLVRDATNPYYVIIDPSHDSERVVAAHGGWAAPEKFLAFLAKGQGINPDAAKVARRD